MPQTLQFPGGMPWERQWGLGLAFHSQLLPRARNGESLVVQQLLDAQYGSTSLRRYMRWPVLLLTGFNWANSVSQKRNTYAGNLQSVETSPIRKYSLSGIMTSSFRDALLDFGRALMRNSILHYNAFRVSSTIGGAEQALEPTKNLSRGVSVERPGKTCTRVLLAFSAFSF